MSFLRDLTSGNPFATQIGQYIDRATDGSQASEDWGLFMEICDMINEQDDGPKDAIKAIKKKLSMTVGKNYNSVMYTLTLLETCVKNCGKRFHLQVANKDFIHDLVKIIGPKNDPPQIVQEKVLSLIQTWADAFQGQPDLKEVGKVYMDLKQKGIEFPMTDLDNMAPIHTPARVTPAVQSSPVRAPTQPAQPRPNPMGSPQMTQAPPQMMPQQQPPQMMPQQQPPQQDMGGPILLNGEQLAKLRSELDVVQQNNKVLSEMLTEMTPGSENGSDLELLQELNSTCRQMQKRIMELIERVQNEEVTCELLRINDELNNVFLRYDRFERLRSGTPSSTPASQQQVTNTAAPPPSYSDTATLPLRGALPPPAAAPTSGEPSVANLIDFDTPSPATAQSNTNPFANVVNTDDVHVRLANMSVGSGSVSNTLSNINSTPAQSQGNDEDFDMFAQSRTAFEENKQNLPSGAAYKNQTQDQFQGGLGAAMSTRDKNIVAVDTEADYDEMEKWLKENPGVQPAQEATSSEFDQFLASRAQEVDTLPDSNSGNNTQNRNNRGNRQMQKDDTENALFAL